MVDAKHMAIERQLKDQPTPKIKIHRDDIDRHMRYLRTTGIVVSLAEYRRHFQARRVLDQILEQRRRNGR